MFILNHLSVRIMLFGVYTGKPNIFFLIEVFMNCYSRFHIHIKWNICCKEVLFIFMTPQIYKDLGQATVTSPYMTHTMPSSIHGLQFCPFEDVLGVGHSNGFSSLIIPGR